MGGLGNQMFQYAAGRRLAYVHRTELKLDLSWFNEIAAKATPRKYELAAFKFHPLIASSEDVARYLKPPYLLSALNVLNRLFPLVGQKHITEKHFHFDPAILSLPDNVYLDGYWQSPRYFVDIEEVIRSEFTITSELTALNKQITEFIARTESVAVHIRRGDYVANPVTSRYHGTCTLDYYRAAVDAIASRVKKPHFFLFSDDPAWTKNNLLSIQPMTMIDHNGPDKAYEDMRLMSLCRHHIIANSSFSWWGAWLSRRPDKIVVAPRKWFGEKQVNTDDLLPEQWLRK
jgi:hypothetical protein